jgi:hypothetical protein
MRMSLKMLKLEASLVKCRPTKQSKSVGYKGIYYNLAETDTETGQ